MNRRILISLLGLLAGGFNFNAIAQPSLPQPASLRTAAALSDAKLTDAFQIKAAFTNDMVEVIVALTPPPGLLKANFASQAALDTLRPQIKQLQQDVLAALPAGELQAGYRFDNIAGFSARVTPAGLQALQNNPQVVSIEPVFEVEMNLAQGIPLMNGLATRSSYNGAGLAIAICDTGVDYTHPRLGGGGFPNGKVIGGYDVGDNDANPMPSSQAHGTCCAGIAAGDPGTVGDYIGGVAYNAKLYALKITSGTGTSATTAAMIAAWDWCVTHKNDDPSHPIMVISTSFSGGRYLSACDGTSPSMTTAANNAVAAGITVLVSSGNDGYCDAVGWPACISSVISVGAVYDASFGTYQPCISADSCAPKNPGGCSTGYYASDTTAADKVTSYANVASFLTLFAPANQCYTLDIVGSPGYSTGDYYDSFGGTSAACPYAAGAVACLQSAAKALTGSYLTPAEVKSRLLAYGNNVTDTKVAITKPRVNLGNAIQSLVPVSSTDLTINSTALTGGNGNQGVDPNECNTLNVILRNNGNTTATNVTATLTTSTPGVTLVQGVSTYPNIAGGANAANTTAFKFSTAPSFICGTPVNLTLTINYTGGAKTNAFSLADGGANYDITSSSGVGIVSGTTDVGNHSDNGTTGISLPFSYTFYGQDFNNATVSANGTLQFTSANNAPNNDCLPATGFNNTIFAHWDDLRTDGRLTDLGVQGIYTSISGVSPNRIFNIEWRASYFAQNKGGNPLNFEVRLYEGQSRFDIIYGTLNGTGSGATVGAQKDTGSSIAQYSCNTASLSAGLQLTFLQGCTDGGGPCPVTVADFTASPTNGSAPLLVTFTNLSTGASNYTWNFGNGHTSTNVHPVNTYTNAGNYSVTLTAISPGGTNALTRTNYITITNALPPPVTASFTANPTNGLAPLLVTFTNLSTGATNYSWDFGNGHTSSNTHPSNTYSNAGVYSVTLTAFGAGGTNSLTLTNLITVTNPPPPPVVANFAADPTNGLAPLLVTFTNLSNGANNYTWDFGDGNTSTNAQPVNTYSNAGVYSVTLTAFGAGGTNSLTLTNLITVTNPPPPPVVANFAADPTNGLAPLLVTFTNLSTSASDYSWDFGDGQTSTNEHPSNTYSNAGDYSVTLTATGPGGTNTLTLTNLITATNLPPPQLFILPATLDFGLVVTGASAQAEFVISNAGSATLTGSASGLGLPFGFAAGTSFASAGAEATNVLVNFTPSVPGVFSNEVIFASNGGTSTNTVIGRSIGELLILSPGLTNDAFQFSFETVLGLDYQVQYTDSLETNNWQTLQTVTGDGTLWTITNIAPASAQQFFRLQVP